MNGAKSPKEIGEILGNTRRQKALTLESVCKATRIQPRIIEALEQGRAEETLNRVYTVLFLRKYAAFLELDPERLAESYKSFYPKTEKQILELEEEPLMVSKDVKKWIIPAISVGLAVMVIFFALFIGRKVSVFFRVRKTIPRTEARKPVPKVKAEEKKESAGIFPISGDKPIKLTLRSSSEAWMRVKENGKVIFEGTMPKDTRKEWSSDSAIELWVGRAEALEFAINGKSVGQIGKGGIKNIRISREGLKVGKKWLLKAEE